MYKNVLRQGCFQHKGLIESVCIGTLAEEILANAQVDGENGHHDFRTRRESCRKLFLESGTIEFHLFRIGRDILVGYAS